MCHVLLRCGLGFVIGELRRVCSLAAGASACTPCTAGSYSASTGARPHLCVRESAVPPAVCTWVCVLFMCASSCFAGKHQAECDATRDRGRKLSQQVITVQMSWMWLSECLVSTPPAISMLLSVRVGVARGRSYSDLAPGASSSSVCAACLVGTYAGSTGPWQCILAQKFICGRHVCHAAKGSLHHHG